MHFKLVCFLFIFSGVYGQTTSIPKTQLIDILTQREHISISSEQGLGYQIVNPENSKFKYYAQFLIKNKKGLFCFIQGTGIVYSLQEHDKDSLRVIRIDSTHYHGYNNSAIIFSNNDTLFSFGGNGFWKFNGQLRYFDEVQKEWNIIEIENEIHGSKNLFYLDEQTHLLYYASNTYKDPGTGKFFEGNEVLILNLRTKKIIKLGKLNSIISSLFFNPNANFSSILIPISSLQASLLSFDINNQFLINFKNNSIRKLESKIIKDIFYGNSNMIKPRILFEENGVLYYTKSNDSTYKVYQTKINSSDFENIKLPLYIAPIKNDYSTLSIFFIILSFILLVSGMIYYFLFFNLSKENSTTTKNTTLFNQLEINLIKYLHKKTMIGDKLGCNSDELNHILGLKKKTLEIQKKTRTETIGRINQKYKNKFNTDEELIIRLRTEEDRRFYRYIVKQENLDKLF